MNPVGLFPVVGVHALSFVSAVSLLAQ